MPLAHLHAQNKGLISQIQGLGVSFQPPHQETTTSLFPKPSVEPRGRAAPLWVSALIVMWLSFDQGKASPLPSMPALPALPTSGGGAKAEGMGDF